ncbi:MAG: hypothetical protein EHM17_06200 [Verrucomicrobiaceae bacterium]|nr:MAG: hypothetical protein EHM17_06200 [Verrucomicrobiaceae bacterium]
MKFNALIFPLAAMLMACGLVHAQQAPAQKAEAEVMDEPAPPAVLASAVAAVAKLGDEVVLGRYQVAIERMNPVWKERTAARMGGMEALEKQLAGVAAQMVQQGISMISFKPQGQPRAYGVSPGKKTIKENGRDIERLVFTKWLVLVPTVTTFRIIQQGKPRPLVIESTGYQIAISEKDKSDWTFIDGAALKPADLRGLFITLPPDMELPPVGKREVR